MPFRFENTRLSTLARCLIEKRKRRTSKLSSKLRLILEIFMAIFSLLEVTDV
jgi:hypothetical protein